MPYARPTLSQIITLAAQDVASSLQGSDPLLRFSNLNIVMQAVANLANLHYGYQDWIAEQGNPFTATGEFLEAWAALKRVYRKAAQQASNGMVSFPGIANTDIPLGTILTRGDGVQFTTTADGKAGVPIPAIAAADPTGLTGAFGNCAVNTVMTLGTAIQNVQSNGTVTTAFTNGVDLELDPSLRTRMLQAYQNPPQGGAVGDYVTWALEVEGVTRAWCNPNGFGPGTVVVYTMFDLTEEAFGGFPQGTNGCATSETRGTTATGDQLTVANAIYPLRPATALVWSVSPSQDVINFTIAGSAGFSAATKAAIAAAISAVFVQYGSPLSSTAGKNGTVDLSYINSTIGAISGTSGFVITAPAANIVGTTGQLPVLGTITWNP